MLAITVDSLRIRGHVLSGPMEIEIPDGEIHLLRGPNGCGKSLLLDAVCGVIRLKGIGVLLSQRRLRHSSAYGRWRAGIRRMFQTPILPTTIEVQTVWDRVSQGNRFGPAWLDRADAFLGACSVPLGSGIGELSFGQRRAVDLVYSLASGSVHLLDEPFAGMRADAIPFAIDLISSAAAHGNSVLVVDHTAETRPELFDAFHDWVLNDSPAVSGNPWGVEEQIWLNERNGAPHAADSAWRVERLEIGETSVAQDLDLTLPAGTAIVCEGGNGTGKSTLLRALAGVAHPWPGVDGLIYRDHVEQMALLSPQPPKLINEVRVVENLCFMLGGFGRCPRSRLDDARALLRGLGFDRTRLRRRAEVLSGGEAAIVALVGAVLSPRPILLLDEPFESMSPQTLPRALRLLTRALEQGKSAVIVAHNPAVIDAADPASVIALSRSTPASGKIVGAMLKTRHADLDMST